MKTEEYYRTSAGIFDTDLKEYNHLMAGNKRAASRALTAHCNSIINLIQKYQGQIVDIGNEIEKRRSTL